MHTLATIALVIFWLIASIMATDKIISFLLGIQHGAACVVLSLVVFPVCAGIFGIICILIWVRFIASIKGSEHT